MAIQQTQSEIRYLTPPTRMKGNRETKKVEIINGNIDRK